jgi:hypothetical protein
MLAHKKAIISRLVNGFFDSHVYEGWRRPAYSLSDSLPPAKPKAPLVREACG